jgi:hypothetical protein
MFPLVVPRLIAQADEQKVNPAVRQARRDDQAASPDD